MRDKIVKPERRRLERRGGRLEALGAAIDEAAWSERRIHCWDLDPRCDEQRRKRCAAHFVLRNCWDLWAAEYFPSGRRPCCHSDLDCGECSIAVAKFGDSIPIHVEVPSTCRGNKAALSTISPILSSPTRMGSYCPFLFRGKDVPPGRDGDEAARLAFKCQHRPGIVLHSSYVSEVCGCPDHRECSFYGSE